MKIRQVAKINRGQDGAIYGTELFRFNTKGHCAVYYLPDIKDGEINELNPIAEFTLDRTESIMPHCNAVCFGAEFYEDGDEYPLLYSNIYNNYKGQEDERIGVCCVYRIQRKGNEFSSTLVQLIKIGFCEDPMYWKVSTEKHGVRPYGNFVVDRENRSYYAFVMKNEELGTKYFRFDLPLVRDGVMDPEFNVKKVVLGVEDIRESFDLEYHRYIQGAAFRGGKIYSTEGFSGNKVNCPAIRVIDCEQKTGTYVNIMDMGFQEEPEFIDFYGDTCFYSDAHGNLYTIEF